MLNLHGLEGTILSMVLVVCFMVGMYHVSVEISHSFTVLSYAYHTAIQGAAQ